MAPDADPQPAPEVDRPLDALEEERQEAPPDADLLLRALPGAGDSPPPTP